MSCINITKFCSCRHSTIIFKIKFINEAIIVQLIFSIIQHAIAYFDLVFLFSS